MRGGLKKYEKLFDVYVIVKGSRSVTDLENSRAEFISGWLMSLSTSGIFNQKHQNKECTKSLLSDTEKKSLSYQTENDLHNNCMSCGSVCEAA